MHFPSHPLHTHTFLQLPGESYIEEWEVFKGFNRGCFDLFSAPSQTSLCTEEAQMGVSLNPCVRSWESYSKRTT